MGSTNDLFSLTVNSIQNNVSCIHGLGTHFSKNFLDRHRIWHGSGDDLANAPLEPEIIGFTKCKEIVYQTIYCEDCLASKKPSAISWSIQWYERNNYLIPMIEFELQRQTFYVFLYRQSTSRDTGEITFRLLKRNRTPYTGLSLAAPVEISLAPIARSFRDVIPSSKVPTMLPTQEDAGSGLNQSLGGPSNRTGTPKSRGQSSVGPFELTNPTSSKTSVVEEGSDILASTLDDILHILDAQDALRDKVHNTLSQETEKIRDLINKARKYAA